MMRYKKILIALAGVLVIICMQQSFGQLQERNCQPNKICVFPGDFLKYSHWINTGTNDTVTYNFTNFIGNDKINVHIGITSNGTKVYNSSLLVDLNNGLTNITRPDGSVVDIAVLVPIPIQYNKTQDSYEETLTIDGIKRKAVVLTSVSQFNSRDKEIDEQTGIVLGIHQTASDTGGKIFTVSGILTLLDTNIIPNFKSSSNSGQESISTNTSNTNLLPQTGSEFWIIYLVIGFAVGVVVLYFVKFRQKQVAR